MLSQTVGELLKLADTKITSNKKIRDIKILPEICKMDVAEALWQIQFSQLYPFSLNEALEIVFGYLEQHPEWFVTRPWKGQPISDCNRCITLPGFPLANREQIINIKNTFSNSVAGLNP